MVADPRPGKARTTELGRTVGEVLDWIALRLVGTRVQALRREVDRIAAGLNVSDRTVSGLIGDRTDRAHGAHGIQGAGHDALAELAVALNRLATRLAADESSRARSQESLSASEEQYRLLFEQSRDAILITTPAGQVVDINQAGLDLMGYSRDEMLELHATRMYADPAERLRFMSEMEDRGSVRQFETRFRTKSGTLIDCVATATMQRGEDGSIVSYQSIVRDVTRQRLSEKLLAEYNQTLERQVAERTQELRRTLDELKTAQAQLVEAEKMAALGALVAGVAHEINTPIGVGVTAASLLDRKSQEIVTRFESGALKRSDLLKYLEVASRSSHIILANLERAAELIRSFKQVAVDQSSEQRRAFAIRGYLQEILLSLHPKLKRTRHSIEIRGEDNLIVNSYPGAFAQIVTNLVMNSLIHAYGPADEGHIVFDIRRVRGGGNSDRIVLTYTDDGCGIADEHLGKVFEPFFSTKRGQGGTGLGLHIVYNLITQRLRGTIRCESTSGRGTAFIVEMPLITS